MTYEYPEDPESFPKFAVSANYQFPDGVVILRQLSFESKTQGLNSKWEVIWETKESIDRHLAWSWYWYQSTIKCALQACVEFNGSIR